MACPFCALSLHHFAPSAKVEQQFRQRARFVHPDKRMPEFKEQAAVEFKLLDATRDLAQLYTDTGVMPFACPGPAQTSLPDHVPIRADTRWPAAGSRDRPDQQTDPKDSHKEWTQRKWRWIGKCQKCGITAHSVWAHGAAPPKLVGWSRHHLLCPECNKW